MSTPDLKTHNIIFVMKNTGLNSWSSVVQAFHGMVAFKDDRLNLEPVSNTRMCATLQLSENWNEDYDHIMKALVGAGYIEGDYSVGK